jgi:hypothetical protein
VIIFLVVALGRYWAYQLFYKKGKISFVDYQNCLIRTRIVKVSDDLEFYSDRKM